MVCALLLRPQLESHCGPSFVGLVQRRGQGTGVGTVDTREGGGGLLAHHGSRGGGRGGGEGFGDEEKRGSLHAVGGGEQQGASLSIAYCRLQA